MVAEAEEAPPAAVAHAGGEAVPIEVVPDDGAGQEGGLYDDDELLLREGDMGIDFGESNQS